MIDILIKEAMIEKEAISFGGAGKALSRFGRKIFQRPSRTGLIGAGVGLGAGIGGTGVCAGGVEGPAQALSKIMLIARTDNDFLILT